MGKVVLFHAGAHHAVGILRQPLQREQRVVRLHDHVAHLVLVGEDRVGLHQLLWIPADGREEEEPLEMPSRPAVMASKHFLCAEYVFVNLSLSFSRR